MLLVAATVGLLGGAACTESGDAFSASEVGEDPPNQLELSDEIDAGDATEGCGGDLSDIVLPDDPGIDSLVSFGGRLAAPDGDDTVDLLDDPVDSEPEWSADGRLAVVDADGISLLEFDGGTEAEVRSLGIAEGRTPSIDPIGEQVAFVRDGNVWARSLEGGDEVELGPTDGEQAAAWSHDGRHVAVDRGENVYIVEAAGGEQTTLPRDRDGEASEPAWSPVDDLVAYLDGSGISVIGLDGQPRRAIVFGGDSGFPMQPEWSPDGRLLSFLWVALGDPRGGFQTTVCVSSLDGGAPVDLAIDLGTTTAPPVWSPDGRYLLARRSASGEGAGISPGLVAIDVRTRETRVVSQFAREGRWISVDAETDDVRCDVLDTWVAPVDGYLDDLSPFEPTVASVLGRVQRVLASDDGSARAVYGQLIQSVRGQLEGLAQIDSGLAAPATVLLDVDEVRADQVEAVRSALAELVTGAEGCGVDVVRQPDDEPPSAVPGDLPPTPEGELFAWAGRFSGAVYDVTSPIASGLIPAITGEHAQPPDGSGPDWPAVRDSCAESLEALPALDAAVASTPQLADSVLPLAQSLAADHRTFLEGCAAAAAVEDYELLREVQGTAERIARLSEHVQQRISELIADS